MADSSMAIQTMRGIQQSLLLPQTSHLPPAEPKGAVYTKRWVVDLLLDLAGYKPDVNLVDALAIEPAAGDGAFLGPMIERLVECCRNLGRDIAECVNSIIAYELESASAERARRLAIKTLVDREVIRTTAENLAFNWIRTGDYLLESIMTTANFVIGNPPYVRLEDIPAETSSLYRNAYRTMCGRADLYVGFFEAGLHQLREGGTCAFICADRWMRNQYGAELRQLITSSFSLDLVIEMHDADAFHDEVSAYPAITIIRRKKQGTAIIASVGPEAENFSSHELSANLLGNQNCETIVLSGVRSSRVDNWFHGDAPWPCHSPQQLELLRRLEENFAPLELSAKIGIGVATGNDKVFITKDEHLVEPSRLLKLCLAKDINKGTLQWSGHYLIDPWDSRGLVSLSDYPRLRSYFEKHGLALKKRHTAVKNVHAWYRTIDRVTHNLTEQSKLYIADINGKLEPVLDYGETYPHHNLYYIQSSRWDMEVLGGLLMSTIGQFFVESYGVRMRGGYLRFQAQYLRRIRVPSPDALTIQQASALREAFRARDKKSATQIALHLYNISSCQLEKALGY